MELIWFACFSGLYYISCCSCRASEVVISRLVVRGQAIVAQQISTYARCPLRVTCAQIHLTSAMELKVSAWFSGPVPCLFRRMLQPGFHGWFLVCLASFSSLISGPVPCSSRTLGLHILHACVARFGSSLRKFAFMVILAVDSVLVEFVCGAWN